MNASVFHMKASDCVRGVSVFGFVLAAVQIRFVSQICTDFKLQVTKSDLDGQAVVKLVCIIHIGSHSNNTPVSTLSR